MKKVFCALVFVLMLAAVCSAAGKDFVDAGILTYLGTTEAEFQRGLDDLRKAVAPLIPTDEEKGGWAEYDRLEGFLDSLVKTRRVIHFYDSLLSMQMALRSRKIDEIALPEPVGLYLVSNNPKYDIYFSLNMMPSTISFGFKRGNTALQKEFNTAIASMRKDGTLARLQKEFVTELGTSEPREVRFATFKGAKTVRVAVTGDLPPIDFIAADGRPTGYNTAILYEIGQRIGKNIQLVSIEAGARSAALAGERVDVVFWYRNTDGIKAPKQAKGKNLKNVMKDNMDGVILSEPYYEWDTDLIIGLGD
ncbi:MAG: transporter substrate-binding domain-containing protein [Synergistaceae bacterium]|nr:transporter substrate-binding domain-containing protein [Synergistaceae bacterium]MBR0094397.1 transporter substrate-binding domain-containing protein [Synergistaceae bacterium]